MKYILFFDIKLYQLCPRTKLINTILKNIILKHEKE